MATLESSGTSAAEMAAICAVDMALMSAAERLPIAVGEIAAI